LNDKNWQQHPAQYSTYPFARFQGRLGPTSPDNEYGRDSQSQDCSGRPVRQRLTVAVLINGRKSDALNLEYDPKTGQLSFAPPA